MAYYNAYKAAKEGEIRQEGGIWTFIFILTIAAFVGVMIWAIEIFIK